METLIYKISSACGEVCTDQTSTRSGMSNLWPILYSAGYMHIVSVIYRLLDIIPDSYMCNLMASSQ